jgi:hypothetical protein
VNRKTTLKSPPSLTAFDPEWWKIAIALFIALLLQTTILARLSMHGGVLSLCLLLVLWYGMHGGFMRGILFGLIVGTCEDTFSTGTATWAFADAAAGALAGAIGRTLVGGSLLGASLAVVPLTIARYVVFLFIFHSERGALAEAHWGAMLWQCLLNSAGALIALILASRLDLPYAGR